MTDTPFLPATDDDRLRIRSPSEMLSLIPFLVGFYPHDSVVVLLLNRGRMEMTIRVDVADIVAVGASPHLVAALRSTEVDAVFVAGFGHPGPTRPGVEAIRRELAEGLRGRSVQELGCYVVHEHRYWCVAGHGCGEENGQELPAAPPVVAEAVVKGMASLPDRTSLERLAEGADEARELPVMAALLAAQTQVSALAAEDRMVETWRLLEARERSTSDLVRLAVLTDDDEVAETLVISGHRHEADRQVAIWSQVLRECAGAFQLGPLALLGFFAWLSGNGALMVICLGRMHRVQADHPQVPLHPLGGILQAFADQAVPPRLWEPGARRG